MPGGEPEMFVRCSDPDIICETKKMVLVALRHRSVLCALPPWAVFVSREMPSTHGTSPCISPWQGIAAVMRPQLPFVPN